MELLLHLIILLSLCGVLHTYLLYPWLTIRMARKSTSSQQWFAEDSIEAKQTESSKVFTASWPRVSVLMAVHNEEKVLANKLDALLQQDYPGEYQVLVGSDNSSDATNDILRSYANKDVRLRLFLFESRQGKPGIINQLTHHAGQPASDHFFLLTDASVMLSSDVVTELIQPTLTRPDLAVVDARMIHTGMQASGIGKTEERYISSEVKLKQAEGQLWGYMMGPFGGCYALRSDFFQEVPPTFLVDDFYLCLAAYEAGGKGISVASAHCFEGVGQQLGDEFKRKVRISAGNWQNARRFQALWWPPFSSLGYAFFSHKILRWLTPFLLLLLLISLGLMGYAYGNYWAECLFYLLLLLFSLPVVVDLLLVHAFNIHWQPMRAVRYFLAMNLALLAGYFRYLNGIKSNVWQPSQRH